MKSLFVAVALAASAIPAHADVEVGIYASLPGQPIDSVDVFYDQLAPYGIWIQDPDAGLLFMPNDAGFVPYTYGHWEYTDVGLVWISSEPFAWATSHYGRWWFADRYGRWVWLPDTTWGPSWVDWRETDGDFGWAPMAPQFAIEIGYEPPLAGWHYCPAEHIVDVDVTRYYEPPTRVAYVHREARPIQATATVAGSRVVVGPPPERLRAHQVTVQPRPVTAKTVGRMSPSELQTAVTRARERKPQIERQNQQRIEATPSVQKAIRAPARTTTPTQPRATTQPTPQATQPRVTQPAPQQPTQPRATQPEPRAVQPRATQPEPRAVQPRGPTPTQPRTIEPKPQPQPRAAEPRPEPQTRAPEPRPQPQTRTPEPRPQPQTRTPEPQPQTRAPEPRPQAQPQPQAQPRQAPPASRGREPKRDDRR